MKFCGEIQYETPEGNVHSDICFNCNPSNDSRIITDTYREFLHNCLNEWLDKSKGTGAFWVGNPEYFASWEKD